MPHFAKRVLSPAACVAQFASWFPLAAKYGIVSSLSIAANHFAGVSPEYVRSPWIITACAFSLLMSWRTLTKSAPVDVSPMNATLKFGSVEPVTGSPELDVLPASGSPGPGDASGSAPLLLLVL